MRFAQMQAWIKPFGPEARLVRPHPLSGSAFERGYNDAEGSRVETDQAEGNSNSKLDRLAAELRALGIQF